MKWKFISGSTWSILLALFVCPVALAAEDYPVSPYTLLPENAAKLLEAETPADIPFDERLNFAKHYADSGRPALAYWLLEGQYDAPKNIETAFLLFRLYEDFGASTKAFDVILKIMQMIEQTTSFEQNLWDVRLSAMLRYLIRDDRLVEMKTGVEVWRKRFHDWPLLKVALIEWDAIWIGSEVLQTKGNEVVRLCRAYDVCLSVSLPLFDAGYKSLAVKSVMKAFRYADSEAEKWLVISELARLHAWDITSKLLGGLVVSSSNITRWFELSRYENLKEVIAERVSGFAPEDSLDTWRMAGLFSRLDDHEAVARIIGEVKTWPEDVDSLIVITRTLRLLLSAKTNRKDKTKWKKLLNELWEFIGQMQLTKLEKARLILVAEKQSTRKAKATIKKLTDDVETMNGLLADLVAFEGRVVLREPEAFSALVKKFSAFSDKRRFVLIEAMKKWETKNGWRTSSGAKEELYASIIKPYNKGDDIGYLLITDYLVDARKRNEAFEMITQAIGRSLPVAERLALLRLTIAREEALAMLGNRTEVKCLRDQLRKIELLLRGYRDEAALSLLSEITRNEENYDKLFLARLLAKRYLSYKKSLTYMWRKGLVSKDIFVHSVIRLLFDHVEENKAAANWVEVFFVLNTIASTNRIDDPAVSDTLREALYEAGRDVDNAVFEIFEQFESRGPQTLASFSGVAAVLGRNPNPDFFTVVWERIKREQIASELLFPVIVGLLDNPHNQRQSEVEDVFDKWKDALDENKKDSEFFEMGWLLLGAASVFDIDKRKISLDIAKMIKNKNSLSETLKEDIKTLSDPLDTERLPPVRWSSTYEQDYRRNETIANDVTKALERYDWMLEICWSKLNSESRHIKFTISISTDRVGDIYQLLFFDVPGKQKEFESCMRNHLLGLRLKKESDRFGKARLTVNLGAIEPIAVTPAMIDYRRKMANETIERLSDDIEKNQDHENTLDDYGEFLDDLSATLVILAYRLSYDDELYNEVAWWVETIQHETSTAERIRGEAKWIYLGPHALYFAVFLLLCGPAVVVIRRLLIMRRR